MKKIHMMILWACIAYSSTLSAQIDSSGPQGILDAIFSGLDPAKITTGLISDKTVSPYVPLERYDGIIDTVISFDDLLTLPFVLNNMITGSVTVPDNDAIMDIYNQHNQAQLIVPLIIDYDYNKISDSAFIKGLIDSSGIIWNDTIIGGESPYLKKTLMAISFNYNHVPGSSFRFMYDPRLFLTNKSIPSVLKVDFGDGSGIRTLTEYDTLLITYSAKGTHEIIVYESIEGTDDPQRASKVNLVNSGSPPTQDYADCRFLFKSANTVYRYEKKFGITGYHPLTGLPILGFTTVPIYMEAFISIQMGKEKVSGTKHSCLKKPLIFVEGIDFGYENHVDEFFSWGNKFNTLGFENIARAKNINPITGVESNDDLFEHGPEFISKVTDAGYDVIFIDLKYGAADMKLNAKLLEEFIMKMNDGSLKKDACYCGKTYDEIVLLGASMGGQVARYALLDMERNNINNCVREWVNFDSPNQGANIALGLQHFVEWSAANNGKALNLFKESKDNLTRKLDRPASKQLLIYHHSQKNKSAPNSEFNDFYSSLDQMGSYPVKCRKVAISNGSLISVHQDFGTDKPQYSGGELLAELNLPLNLFTSLAFNFHARIYAEEGTDNPFSRCNVDYTKKYVFTGSANWNLYKFLVPISYTACDNVTFNGLGFDYSPGGSNEGIMALDIEKSINKLFNITPGISYHENFGFIPTVSSLGIYPSVWKNNGGPLYNVLNNFGKTRIEGHLPNYDISPFDAIYGPSAFQKNEPHVYISEGLIKWAMDELQMGDYENSITSGSNAGNSYNFGDLYFNRLKSITVNGACILKIFADDYKGYKNRKQGYEEQYYASINKPAENTTFEIYTVENCDPTLVKINNGGSMELGDGKTRKTITHFRSGSKLELMENGTLHILDGSVLVIEKGAKLVYHKGAIIILDGPNAVLQIYGELILPDPDTKFTYAHDPSLVNGFIDFVNSPTITSTGTTNSIEFSGISSANRITRILGGDLIIKGLNSNPGNAISLVKLQKGQIEIDRNCSFKTDASINASQVNFTSYNARIGNKGLVLYGQQGISINDCKFQNLSEGMEIQSSFNNGSSIILGQNLFSNCIKGAWIVNVPIILLQNNFTNCVSGLIIDNCSKFKAENTAFSMNETALDYLGGNVFLSGVIKGCSFRTNTSAIIETGKKTSLTIGCTEIRNSKNAIYAEGEINMSKVLMDKDFGIPGGDCNLINNDKFFTMNFGTLQMINGNNNIIQGIVSKPVVYVDGTIDGTGPFLFAPNILNVENNYWNPDPSATPSYYNFAIVTNTVAYLGILGILMPAGTAYTNCAANNFGLSAGTPDNSGVGELNGGGVSNPKEIISSPVIQNGKIGTDVLLYPVPADDILTIEIPGTGNFLNLMVFDIEGSRREAEYELMPDGKIELRLLNLTGGAYLVEIKTIDKTFRKSFIVIH